MGRGLAAAGCAFVAGFFVVMTPWAPWRASLAALAAVGVGFVLALRAARAADSPGFRVALVASTLVALFALPLATADAVYLSSAVRLGLLAAALGLPLAAAAGREKARA